MDKPGTPGSKGRSTTPNAGGGPGGAKGILPPVPAGYPNSPYQRAPQDPYQRPPADPAYGRPPMPFDPHAHVRTNGIPIGGPLVNAGKP